MVKEMNKLRWIIKKRNIIITKNLMRVGAAHEVHLDVPGTKKITASKRHEKFFLLVSFLNSVISGYHPPAEVRVPIFITRGR